MHRLVLIVKRMANQQSAASLKLYTLACCWAAYIYRSVAGRSLLGLSEAFAYRMANMNAVC